MAFTPLMALGGGGGGGGGFPSTDNFVFVDAAANPGGDGSAAKPYQTILEGSLNNNGGSKIVWVMRGAYNERAFLRTGIYLGWGINVNYDGAAGPVVDTTGASFDAKLYGDWSLGHTGAGADNSVIRMNDGDSALWIERGTIFSQSDVAIRMTDGRFTMENGAVNTLSPSSVEITGAGSVVKLLEGVSVFSDEGSPFQMTNGGTLIFGGKAQAFGPPCILVVSGAPSIHLFSTARLYNNSNDPNSIISTPAINVQSYGAIATVDVDANTTIIGSLLVDSTFTTHQ